MKKLIITSVLLLCLVMTGVTACGSLGGGSDTAGQAVKVERGDLEVTVSGSGNIEVFKDSKLTFGIGGRIEEITVEEGDRVSKGDVIARLETGALELAVAQAEVALSQAQNSVKQAESAITQAQLSLDMANYNLDKAEDTYKWPELEVQYTNVEQARLAVENTQNRISAALAANPSADTTSLQSLLANAQANLVQEEIKLKAMLSGDDKEEVAMKKLQVQIAEEGLALAEQSLEVAKKSPELAELSLAQVRKQLADATIAAPFDGIVATVYAEEKDTVSTVNPIVYLIDTSKMELKVDVDEIDVADVKIGQRAKIEVDALPDLELEGEVSFISQLPREEGGVIIYEVKVRFDALADSGLKGGMSASTDIVVKERAGVLLVPNRVIGHNAEGESVVEVVSGDKTVERVVTTGMTDGFDTEIVSGLEEGELLAGK
jgi:HlyD family secretion protein